MRDERPFSPAQHFCAYADITLDGLHVVGSAIRVRFIAQDLGAGSLAKAAIDAVNQDGLVKGLDFSFLLSQ